jgi:hypothetical protein
MLLRLMRKIGLVERDLDGLQRDLDAFAHSDDDRKKYVELVREAMERAVRDACPGADVSSRTDAHFVLDTETAAFKWFDSGVGRIWNLFVFEKTTPRRWTASFVDSGVRFAVCSGARHESGLTLSRIRDELAAFSSPRRRSGRPA